MRGRACVLLVGIFALLAASCGGDDGGGGGGEVKIGVLAPLTGAFASDGQDMVDGAQLAVDEINKDGGIDGNDFDLVTGDTQDLRPDAVTSSVTRLVSQEQVDAVVAGYASGTNFEINLLEPRDLPYILTGNTQQTTAIIGDDIDKYSNIWSQQPSYDAYETDLPKLIDRVVVREGGYELPNRKIYMITSDTPYSLSISDGLEESFREAGWEVVGGDKVPFRPISDWRAILRKVQSEDPALIVNTDYQPSNEATFINQFNENPTDSLVFLQYGPSVPEFTELSGDRSDGVLYNVFGTPLPPEKHERAREVLSKFEDRYGRIPGEYGTLLYEQVYTYANALREAGGDPDDYEAVNEAIGQTDVTTAQGHLQFDLSTHLAKEGTELIPLNFLQIQKDGERVLLSPEKFATGKFTTPSWLK